MNSIACEDLTILQREALEAASGVATGDRDFFRGCGMEEPEHRKNDDGIEEQNGRQGYSPAETENLHERRHDPAQNAFAGLFHVRCTTVTRLVSFLVRGPADSLGLLSSSYPVRAC